MRSVRFVSFTTIGAMFCASVASAAFTNLTAVLEQSSISADYGANGTAVVDIYRVYAVSDDPANDRLLSLSNGAAGGITIGVDAFYWTSLNAAGTGPGSGFLNHSLGNVVPVFGPDVGNFPDLTLDSYLTIGTESAVNGSNSFIFLSALFSLQSLNGLEDSFIANINLPSTNAALLIFDPNLPDIPETTPDPVTGRVMIAQVAVAAGENVAMGMFVNSTRLDNRGTNESVYLEVSTVPTPGILPLLAMAGLAATRRRSRR